jgi:hypothetical protein
MFTVGATSVTPTVGTAPKATYINFQVPLAAMSLGGSMTSCPALDYYLVTGGNAFQITPTTPVKFSYTPSGNTNCFVSVSVTDYTAITASGFADGTTSYLVNGNNLVTSIYLAWFP